MWIKIGEAFKDFFWKIGAQKQQMQKTLRKLAEGSLFYNSANVYLFKVINRNSRKRCEICLKLTVKTPERRSLTSFSCFCC